MAKIKDYMDQPVTWKFMTWLLTVLIAIMAIVIPRGWSNKDAIDSEIKSKASKVELEQTSKIILGYVEKGDHENKEALKAHEISDNAKDAIFLQYLQSIDLNVKKLGQNNYIQPYSKKKIDYICLNDTTDGVITQN